MAAIAQAKALGLNVYSGQPDPDFYYGDAVELTLKELRLNTAAYEGIKVAFEGVVTMNGFNSVYVEDYDEETGRYYGILVYYGYSLSGGGLDVLTVGNLARIVGTLQYYEAGDSYQISGVTYRQIRPDDPGNLQKLGEGYAPAYAPMTAEAFANGAATVETAEGPRRAFPCGACAVHHRVDGGPARGAGAAGRRGRGADAAVHGGRLRGAGAP